MRKPTVTADEIARQPHRANPANPATAHCAMWLSPEQQAAADERHRAQGHVLAGTTPCPCGNHNRQMWTA